ncbi:hypothetical protein B0H13DRAFT_1885496 [Mycena leptocephala]|nr:hypothetical protein B0H13DRAFT_1885496 [Mycena leptocephala]
MHSHGYIHLLLTIYYGYGSGEAKRRSFGALDIRSEEGVFLVVGVMGGYGTSEREEGLERRGIPAFVIAFFLPLSLAFLVRGLVAAAGAVASRGGKSSCEISTTEAGEEMRMLKGSAISLGAGEGVTRSLSKVSQYVSLLLDGVGDTVRLLRVTGIRED